MKASRSNTPKELCRRTPNGERAFMECAGKRLIVAHENEC